jgi:hypothetical protein
MPSAKTEWLRPLARALPDRDKDEGLDRALVSYALATGGASGFEAPSLSMRTTR